MPLRFAVVMLPPEVLINPAAVVPPVSFFMVTIVTPFGTAIVEGKSNARARAPNNGKSKMPRKRE